MIFPFLGAQICHTSDVSDLWLIAILEAVGVVISSEEAAIFSGFLFQLVVQLLSRLLLGKSHFYLDQVCVENMQY